jgi:hypothetical protein
MIYLFLSRRQSVVSRWMPARFSRPKWGGGTSVYLFLTLSLSLLLFACPDASATPSGSIGVVWAKNDPGPVYSTSGDIGSQAYVHIHFYDTGVMGAPTLKEIRLHEVAGHQQDQVWTNVSFNNGSYPGICPHCGDGSGVHSQFWMTTGFHNGSWQISATVHYLKWGVGYVDWPVPPITVNLSNAIVTPTGPQNPDPILWDPDTMQTVPVSANVDMAYRSNMTAIKLEIFDSLQALVKTVALDRALAPGTNSITYNWDGSQDPPRQGIAPKGVYLFKWTVGHSGGEEDYDCEKSSFLTISTPNPQSDAVSVIDSNPTNWYFRVAYTLTEGTGKAAKSGEVRLYDPDNQAAGSWNVASLECLEHGNATDGLTTTGGGKTHAVKVPVPRSAVNKEGKYTFLLLFSDDEANLYKGHQEKWALQKGNDFTPSQPAVTVKTLLDPMTIHFDSPGIIPSSLNLTFRGVDVTDKAQILSDTEVRLPWPTYPNEQQENEHRFSLRVQADSKGARDVIAVVSPLDFNPQSDDTAERDVHLGYYMTHPAHVRVKVYTLDENGGITGLVRTFEEDKAAGEQESVWDGKIDSGECALLEPDYQCDIFEVRPDESERLIASLDPAAQLRLGGTKSVPTPRFVDGIYRVRVFVPTVGTLKVKLWNGHSSYTMSIYKYNSGSETVVPFESGTDEYGARYVQVEVGGEVPTTATIGEYCVHIFRNGAPVQAFTLSASFMQVARDDDVPWTGIWWPYEVNVGPAHLYDSGTYATWQPYFKYDLFVLLGGGTNPDAWNTELNGNGIEDPHYHNTPSTDDDWEGHCHAWAAAAIMEPEPRAPQTHTPGGYSMTFWVGDLKGLLTGLYDRNWENRPRIGHRYNGEAGDNFLDPPPDVLHNDALVKYLRMKHQALVMDLDPLSDVWSYPVWKYEESMVAWPNRRDVVDVDLVLYYTGDTPFSPDYIMAAPPENDPNVAHVYLRCWLLFNSAGYASDGQWTDWPKTPSGLPARPGLPDFAWVPTSPTQPQSCFGKLTPTTVYTINGR